MSAWAVVVGTAVGAAAGLATQQLRFRRDDRARWLDLRRELAIRFLEATDDVFKWTRALNAMSTARESGIGMEFDGVATEQDVTARIHDADDRTRRLNTEIDLVATKPEREAAARLRESVWKRDDEQPAGEVAAARDAFQEAVRRGLVPRRQR